MSVAMPDSTSTVTLREVTHGTLRSICNLKVTEHQNQFVAPNAVSVAEAYFVREHAWFRAIYADETPVGFVMVYVDTAAPEYFLWRFMIDARFQKFGYGRKALQLVIDHVRGLPGAKEMKLSFHEGEGNPSGFYGKLGFAMTDEYMDGERVMVLTF